ncbi:MAG: hypothetical protein DHS20C21_03640 [Gemmatimonadota bacterium]|nr:MAG: hypothetical protein DHS20C21_03640 [Gemmatimonadota bacterium]
MILRFSRSVVFPPGSNRMGAPAPPSWVYLLPSLAGWRIRAIGEVSPRTLAGLQGWGEPDGPRTLLLAGRGAEDDPAWTTYRTDGSFAIHASPDAVDAVRGGKDHVEWWLSPGDGDAGGDWIPDDAPQPPLRSVIFPPLPLGAAAGARRWLGKVERVLGRWAHRTGLRRLDATVRAEDPSGVPLSLTKPGSGASDGALFLPEGTDARAVPGWIQEVAADAGVDLSQARWRLIPSRGFRSQKILFLIQGPTVRESAAVKVTQDARFNARLDNEGKALSALASLTGLPAAGFPSLRFVGVHRGLSVVGQDAVVGEPFRARSTAQPDCPCAALALRWIEDLAVASASPSAPAEVGDALGELVDRFRTMYRPSTAVDEALRRDVATLTEAAVPSVFMHGDPGPWNLLITPGNEVVFLDWENAESAGLPLWDLLYFLRTYGALAAERRGIRWTPAAFAEQFLETSDFSRLLERCVDEHRLRLSLPRAALAPLLRTHLAALATREAWSLDPRRLRRGVAARVLETIVSRAPRSPVWQRLERD